MAATYKKMNKKILILQGKSGTNQQTFANGIIKDIGERAEVKIAKISDIFFIIDQKKIHIEIDGQPITTNGGRTSRAGSCRTGDYPRTVSDAICFAGRSVRRRAVGERKRSWSAH